MDFLVVDVACDRRPQILAEVACADEASGSLASNASGTASIVAIVCSSNPGTVLGTVTVLVDSRNPFATRQDCPLGLGFGIEPTFSFYELNRACHDCSTAARHAWFLGCLAGGHGIIQ